MLALIHRAHAALGLPASSYRLSLRGDDGKYAGADAAWEQAERLLRAALDAAGVPYVVAPGEAAFYGPKIDVQIADPAGRESSVSTIQIDFHQPARFGLSYRDASGGRAVPVLVHRSLVGSLERLFAVLLEAHAGAFPVWYSPVQLGVLPVGAAQQEVAEAVARDAIDAGLRAEVHPDGSLGARIRDAAHRKIPYLAVVGAREAADGLVALRLRDGRQLPAMPYAEAIALVGAVSAERSPGLLPAAAG
jgi:threonyl-tRNA synthetase